VKIPFVCVSCNKQVSVDQADAQVLTDLMESDQRGKPPPAKTYVVNCPSCGAENRVRQRSKP
jgi:predicted RNA-binding Zn-ribbon protein involved in translation (DUF1610 family)